MQWNEWSLTFKLSCFQPFVDQESVFAVEFVRVFDGAPLSSFSTPSCFPFLVASLGSLASLPGSGSGSRVLVQGEYPGVTAGRCRDEQVEFNSFFKPESIKRIDMILIGQVRLIFIRKMFDCQEEAVIYMGYIGILPTTCFVQFFAILVFAILYRGNTRHRQILKLTFRNCYDKVDDEEETNQEKIQFWKSS